jgi:hypothetical protein
MAREMTALGLGDGMRLVVYDKARIEHVRVDMYRARFGANALLTLSVCGRSMNCALGEVFMFPDLLELKGNLSC